MSEIRFVKIPPMPRPEKRPGRLSALALWCIAGLGLVLSNLAMLPLAEPLSRLNPQVQLIITNALYYLPFAALPVFLLAKRTPGLYEAYRPNPISLFNVICTAVLALLGVFLVNDITILWSIPFQKLGLDVFAGGFPTPANTRELALSIFTMAAIPAVCEEFLFRGVILSAFERCGTKHAVVFSALLFALLHGSIIGAPSQFILGVVLALLVFWTDSIYAGLIYHTVHNAAAILLDYMQARMPENAEIPADLFTAIGGLAGVLDLGLSILFSAALVLFTLKLFRLRGQLRGIAMEPRSKIPLRRIEVILLIAGLILCALMYTLGLLTMMGGT